MSLTIPITVDFSGGLEMLFSNKRRHSLSIPALFTEEKDGKGEGEGEGEEEDKGKPVTIAFLVDYLCKNFMKDPRSDLFVLDGHIRPGILVLINEADWELEGEETYEIQAGDNILFVSTLHGG